MSRTFDFSIDWLEFTYRAPEVPNGLDVFENFQKDFPEIVKDWEVNADQVTLLGKGRNFYNTVFCFSDEYTVCYHTDKRNMGVHVTFPGHGIWKIADIFGFDSFNEHAAAKEIFRILDERNCEITRLDLAYDDYSKTFTPHDFDVWRVQERIVSDSRRMSYITSGVGCGDTFYIGKRGRDRFIRIYDKAYESKGKIDAIRYEFELKQEWSRVIQDHILNDNYFCFADLLESMFTIKEDWGFDFEYDTFINSKGIEAKTLSDSDACKKTRANIDDKWQLFLDTIREVFAKPKNNVVEVSLKKEKEQYSYNRFYTWLRDYICPSLFIFRELCSEQEFLEFVASGGEDLKPQKKAMIKKYLLEKQLLNNM